MNIKITLIALLIISYVSCKENEAPKAKTAVVKSIQSNSNSLSRDDLNGTVKKVIQSTYLAKQDKTKIEKVALGNIYEIEFNEHGNITSRKYYNSTKQLQTQTIFDAKETQSSNNAKILDGMNRMIKKLKFEYLPNLQVKSTSEFDLNGKLEFITNYTCLSNGKLSQEIKKTPQGIVVTQTSHEYDAQGNRLKSIYNYEKSKMKIVCMRKFKQFDSNGNWLSSLESTSKGSLFVVERKIEYYK